MKVVISLKPLSNESNTRGIGAYTRHIIHSFASLYPHDEIIPTSHEFRSLGADLVHFPFFDPFFLTLPIARKIPTVVTIHDLIPVKYPSHFPRGVRGSIKWHIQRWIVRGVDHIITDSLASKHDIVDILSVPEDKVTVVPLASASDPLVAEVTPKVREEYYLPDKFILYVGDINWSKNVVGLIRAFSAVTDDDYHLVLVGKAFASNTSIPEYKQIRHAIRASSKIDKIHTLGYVPSHHLSSIYSLATVYCQPSFDEGFGLPLLEAMKVGCPVVSSDRGSLREVGGEAALYFDPERDFEQVLDKICRSPAIRQELVRKGRARAKQFSWSEAATLTHKVYEKVLASQK